MKKLNFLKLSLVCLLGGFLLASCGDDTEPVIDPGGSDTDLNVQDGLFMSLTGADPSSTAVMVSEKVEANDFKSQDRSGFVAGYMWLEAGSYEIVQVENKKIVTTIGGSAEAIADGAGSDCDHNGITKVSTQTDGSAFAVATSGLYKVTHDQMLNELIMYNIQDASAIGSATANGWGADTPLAGSVTAEGASWEATDVTLRSGEWKIRLNCNWGINRRVDPNGSLDDPANGYQVFTNFGGTVDGLQAGGANFAQTEDGVYTLKLNWTPKDGFFLETTRTGDAAVITFNPNDYQMAVIGDATPKGWDADQNLFHKEDAGVHTWYGVVTMAAEGMYKFRANDAWDINYGGDLANLTNGGDNIPTPGEGAWYITLTTADEGDTWSATVSDLHWSVIGEGSPSGNWDDDTALVSEGFDADGNSIYTLTGDFTTGGWKFRAGRDWAHNIGGDLTFLTVDGDNIVLGAAGSYTATLKFDGEVYSATVE